MVSFASFAIAADAKKPVMQLTQLVYPCCVLLLPHVSLLGASHDNFGLSQKLIPRLVSFFLKTILKDFDTL